jgi:hypothetical protein
LYRSGEAFFSLKDFQRSWYVYWGIRIFAKSAVAKLQEGDTQIIEAP